MSGRKKKRRQRLSERARAGEAESLYDFASRLAADGRFVEAQAAYERVRHAVTEPRLHALACNDLGAVLARSGDADGARREFEAALAADPSCEPARANLAVLSGATSPASNGPAAINPVASLPPDGGRSDRPTRVAVLSFLFNWPSTGGGTVHTFELARFLARAGFDVKHFYISYAPWQLGQVAGPLPYPAEALDFSEADWSPEVVRERVWQAMDAFRPDHVIITDSWNTKPLLAEAVREYPYVLRFQAMECLCPLNNVRLLPEAQGGFRQCPNHQFARPGECVRCVGALGQRSGSLHQLERDFAGFGTRGYQDSVFRALREAEAVLVVNALHEAMLSPYAECVKVVTAGMDPARFVWPEAGVPPEDRLGRPLIVSFAGLVEEQIKGFNVLYEACRRLWRRRRDFELVATGDPPGRVDEFTRFVGWLSQDNLPRHLRDSDIVAVPTVAQEALGRTAVEAMAAGRPVVASRIGGLPFTVTDGATGLLSEPGDPADLAAKIETLLNDAGLRTRLGAAGRRRFEEHYTWDVIIERHYRPLLSRRRSEPAVEATCQPTAGAGRAGAAGYSPFIPARTDMDCLLEQVARFFSLERSAIERKLQAYRTLHESKRHAERLGERKTLCFEEAFILFLVLDALRPKTVVELGTQEGRSARRILDAGEFLGLKMRLVCFDPRDQVRFFSSSEAEVVRKDVTGRFRREVLEAHRPGLIFADVHAHGLLREAVSETAAWPRRCVLALHDCGPGLCNPFMTISREDPAAVTSSTGVWERHVLADHFGVRDPLDGSLDQAEDARRRLRVFATPHGLALLVPKRLNLTGAAAPRPRKAAAKG